MISKAAENLNGISIAYAMGLVNAAMACAIAFGVHMNDTQIAAVVGLVNTALVLAVHVGHRVGEATSSGSSSAKSQETFGPHDLTTAPPPAPQDG